MNYFFKQLYTKLHSFKLYRILYNLKVSDKKLFYKRKLDFAKHIKHSLVKVKLFFRMF